MNADFSKHLLAAGTMTDTNGAAISRSNLPSTGQRRLRHCLRHRRSGHDRPELGGGTFPTLNVDAIQASAIQFRSHAADTGHWRRGILRTSVTKSGSNQVHGSCSNFVRMRLSTREIFFDHKSDWTLGVSRRLPAMNSA